MSPRLNTGIATAESIANDVDVIAHSNAITLIYLRAATYSQGLGAIEGIERMKNENIK